jgi:hypothetical protein
VRSSRGQALVEAALAVPFVIALALGLLQVALYYHARDVLTSAVQEGARLAAEDGRGLDDGFDRVRVLSAAGLGATIDAVEPSGTVDPDIVQLWVDTRMRPIIPLPIQDQLRIHVRAVAARERFRPGGSGT